METTRRGFFSLFSDLPVCRVFGGGGRQPGAAGNPPPTRLRPTPPCDDHDEPTPALEEGPFFAPRSPERSRLLEQGMAGTALVLRGRVVDVHCRPVANVLLDWWQADDAGEYDNRGYRLRGHQYTDQRGNFELETIVPGLYPGRTRHLHVKVQAPNRRTLTTQLFFPGEPGNRRDRIFDPALLMTVRREGDRALGDYMFVLSV